MIVKKNKILGISDAKYASQLIAYMVEFQKHLHCAFGVIF